MRRYRRASSNTSNTYYSLAFNSRFPMAFLWVQPAAGCILKGFSTFLTKKACISMGMIAPMLLHIGRKYSCQKCWLIVHILSNTRSDPLTRRKTLSQQIMSSGDWSFVLMTSQQVRPMILMTRHGHLRINISCKRKELVEDYTQVGLLLQLLDI